MTAPQPEIAVAYADSYNGYPTEVYDGYGSMDFGSTMVDAPLQRTFTISNSGAGTLALVPSSLVLPEGFSLHTAFPETVGPDDSTSFTVWLDATDAGCFSGTLSFNTNDGDENPFAFYVSGEVTGSSAANLAPTLDAIANPPAIDEDAGLQTVGLTGITAGGSEIQNLSVTASSSNPQLVPNPSVIYTSPGTAGTLTFVPAANQSGTALITVTVTDDGGTGYGGVDRVEQSFLVTVAPVNDAPALVQAIAPIVVSEGSVMTTVGLATYFQDVDLATSGDTLHYEVTVNARDPEAPLYNADLLAAWIENGGLKVVYAAGQTGHVDLTLRAVDQAGLAAQTMVAVTVVPVPVNDSPAALPIPPVTVDEDAADVVLNLLDFFSDAEDPDEDLLLAVALASNPQTNPAALALDAGTGRLTLSFLPDASGAAQYTVSARDSGGKTAQTALSVTVTAVNDPPAGPAAPLDVTLRDASQETVVDLWQYFDDAEEGTDLAYEIVADSLANPEVLDGTPVIDADGYLRLRAAADVNGTAALTVQAGDAEGATALATFTFTTAAAGGTSCTATAAPVPTGPLSPLALPPFDPSAPYLPSFIDPTTMDCYRSPTLTLTASPTDLVEKQEFTIAVAWTNTYHLVLQSPYLASGQLVIKRFEFTSEVGHDVAGPLSYGQPDSRLLPMSGFYAGTAQVRLEFADDMPSGTAADVMSVVLAAVGYCHHPASVTVAPTVNNGDPSVVFETRAVVKDQDGQPLLDGNGNPQTVSAASFNEGDAVIVRGYVTDPALGVSTETFCQSQIAWGDGSVQPLNVNPNDGAFEAKHVYRDDNPTATPSDTYTIIVTATDDDGGVTTQTRTVTVNNVEPTVTIDRIEVRDAVLSTNPVTGVSTYLNPGQLDESEGFTIFDTVTDAGILDGQTVTLRMDLNFDGNTDDPGEEVSFGVAPNSSFTYTAGPVLDDGATYDAAGNGVWGNGTAQDILRVYTEVTDDDTGSGDDSTDIVVHNLDPEFVGQPYITFGYDDDGNPTSVTVHGEFSDRGSRDMHQLYVTWGDGKFGDGSTSSNQPIPVQDGAFEMTRSLSVGEVEEESDVYPVLLRLEDDDTGQATTTLESCGCGSSSACSPETESNAAQQPPVHVSHPVWADEHAGLGLSKWCRGVGVPSIAAREPPVHRS